MFNFHDSYLDNISKENDSLKLYFSNSCWGCDVELYFSGNVEYARTVENANITTVMEPLLFNGPTCVLLISIGVVIGAKFFIKRDKQLRKILYYTPVYVCALTFPTWFLIIGVCNVLNIDLTL